MTNESQGEFLGSVEEHLLIHGIKPDDLENVRKFGAAIGDRMPEYIRHFYAWLETRPDYRADIPQMAPKLGPVGSQTGPVLEP